jgi:hypothetical protein
MKAQSSSLQYMMISYLAVSLSRQFVIDYDSPNLFHLVRLAFIPVGLP